MDLYDMREAMSERGACSGIGPEYTDLFFPVGENVMAGVQAIEKSKRICEACPVADLCRTWARATGQDYGTWGGETEWERRRWRKDRKVVAAA